jgi:hypothetical protein
MPTFPVTITAASLFAPFEKGGPFLVSGRRYVLLTDFVTLKIFMSADGGATWNEQDTVNEPTTGNTGTAFTTATMDASGNIWMAHQDASNSFIQFSAFNTTTNTWGANVVTAAITFGGNACGMEFRPTDSKLVLIGNDTALNDAGVNERLGYALFDTVGLTISGFTACGFVGAASTDWTAGFVVRGTGMMHLFMSSQPHGVAGGTRTFVQQALSDGNVLGPLQTIDTVTDATGNTLNSFPASSDGTTVLCSWLPTTLSPGLVRVFKGTSAATITFTAQTLNFTAFPNVDSQRLVWNSGTAYVFTLMDDGVNGYVQQAVDTGGGFGSISTVNTLLGDPNIFNLNVNAFGAIPWGMYFVGSAFYIEFTGSGSSGSIALFPMSLNSGRANVVILPDAGIDCGRDRINPRSTVCGNVDDLVTSKVQLF